MTMSSGSEDEYNGSVSSDKYIDILEKVIILVCLGYSSMDMAITVSLSK
jgi:hypothetical protein